MYSKGHHNRDLLPGSNVRLPTALASGKVSDAPTSGKALYLKIGLSIGLVLLFAIIGVLVLLVKKRRQHKQAIAGMERCSETRMLQEADLHSDFRPSAGIRTGNQILTPSRAGWTPLPSEETAYRVQDGRTVQQKIKSSQSTPTLFKQRSISPIKLQHVQLLKAPSTGMVHTHHVPIVERSPRNRTEMHSVFRHSISRANTLKTNEDNEDTTTVHENTSPTVQSFFSASSVKSVSGTSAAQNRGRKTSLSMALDAFTPSSSESKFGIINWRSIKHGRSISLGTPPTRPPLGPVPALPRVTGPIPSNEVVRSAPTGNASAESSNSTDTPSVASSPLLPPRVNYPPRSSRDPGSFATTDILSSKSIVYRQRQDPRVTGPQPELAPSTYDSYHRHTIGRSTVASYNEESSTKLTDNDREHHDKDSLSSVRGGVKQTPNSPVRSVSSSKTTLSSRKVTALYGLHPPRAARTGNTDVASNGSPQRRKRSVLTQEGSDSCLLRQKSNETEYSDASNGNDPLRWNPNTPRPSALKGSPNARKGHRRHNTVRISALTPQVFELPTPRSASHNGLPEIRKRAVETDVSNISAVSKSVANVPVLHPDRNCDVEHSSTQALRSSLTPSSPTLSAWILHYRDGTALDDPNSVSTSATTPSLSSQPSSDLLIPEFPAPAESQSLAAGPIKEWLSGSTLTIEDNRNNTQPMASGDDESKQNTTDPSSKKHGTSRTMITLPAMKKKDEEGRDSPIWNSTDPKRGSFVLQAIADLRESLYGDSRSPLSYGITPPVSPSVVSTPAAVEQYSDDKENVFVPPDRALKTANTLSEAVRQPSTSHGSSLPSPEVEDALVEPLDLPSIRWRAASTLIRPQHLRAAHSCSHPSTPTHVPTSASLRSPLGPRSEPAKSVLRTAMVLRRMSSDIQPSNNSEGRRIIHNHLETRTAEPLIGESNDDHEEPRKIDFWIDAPALAGATANPAGIIRGPDSYDENIPRHRSALELPHVSVNTYALNMVPVLSPGLPEQSYISASIQPSLPLPKDVVPRLASTIPSMRSRPPETPPSRRRLRFSRVNGSGATPRSLYDADGFLVSES
nr:hypothetical protein CFP56_30886 [Quercus suber]